MAARLLHDRGVLPPGVTACGAPGAPPQLVGVGATPLEWGRGYSYLCASVSVCPNCAASLSRGLYCPYP